MRMLLPSLLAVSCIDTAVLELPEETRDAKAVIVLLEPLGRAALLAAGDPAVALPRFSVRADDVITVLTYAETLEELGIAPGPIELVASLDPRSTRRLPVPVIAFRTVADPIDWRQVSPELGMFRMSIPTFEECSEAGGCYVTVGDDHACRTPCEVDPPRPPETPERMPCAPPWRESEPIAGVFFCEPPPPTACDPGSMQRYGDAECSLIAPCPAGDFAADLPADPAPIFVRTDAELAGALGAATSGDVIALAKGAYSSAVALPPGVALWGACPRDTVLAGGVRAHGGMVRGLRAALLSNSGVRLEVAGLELGGLFADTGTIAGSAVRIVRVGPRGIAASGRAALTDVVVEGDGTELLLFAVGPSAELELTSFRLDGGDYAAQAYEGGTMKLSEGVIERFNAVGVTVESLSSLLELDRVIIRDRVEVSDRSYFENGVRALEKGTVEGSRVRIARIDARGVWAADDSSIRIEDLVMIEAQEGAFNGCFHAQNFARLELDRAAISDCGGPAVLVSDGFARITNFTAVRSIYGILAAGTKVEPVTVEGALLDGNQLGLCAALEQKIQASDLTILDTHGGEVACGTGALVAGAGLVVSERADVTASRFLFADGKIGFASYGSTKLALSNGEIAGNQVDFYSSTPFDPSEHLVRVLIR